LAPLYKSLLLFSLNWLDAQLTLLWIRLNVATEGNSLMAQLINHGEVSFLGVKLLVGAFAAYVLYRCSHLTLARRGMSLVLVLYAGLMLIHTATGCVALGFQGPMIVLGYFGTATQTFLGIFS
jgi:Domain of unknown function (DUF5658)